jgi:hypothetical protein
MPRLRELQARIAGVALDRLPAEALRGDLRDDRPIAVLDRLRIHRNNTLLGLVDPLAAAFPVVAALVGPEFFERMAIDFIRAFPPKRPDLLSYGQDLPGFIALYPPAASLPYLADMARLELALSFAYHAADAEPLAPQALQGFPAQRLEQLRLQPHPSLRFVASDYPLLAIWQAHQEEGGLDRPIALAQGGVMLLVYRPQAETLIRPVSRGAFALVMALATGQDLAGATQSALTSDPDFSLIDELAGLLAAQLFSEASLP